MRLRPLLLSASLLCGATSASAQLLTTDAGTASGVTSTVASIDASGWMVTPVNPITNYTPDSSPVTFAVQRGGYDTSGNWNANNYTENLVLVKRVRQAYPNGNSLNGSLTAASDWIYSTDTVPAATNSSTKVSPKAVGVWETTDHTVSSASTLTVQFVAYHRNAHSQNAPIPYATCSAFDGVTTVTAVATYSSALSSPNVNWTDKHKIMGYSATLTVSGLANGSYTVNCKAYPWAGGNADAASILDSSTSPTLNFSPLTFYKVASPATPLYISTTGNDSTGNGTSGNPYLTVGKVLNVECPTSTCNRGGQIIYLKEDSPGGGASYTAGTINPTFSDLNATGELLIAPDPTATGAITFTIGTAPNFKTANVHFQGTAPTFKIVRGANVNWTVASGGRLVLEDLTLDMTGATSATLVNSGGTRLFLEGVTTANMTASVGQNTFQSTSGQHVMMIRGSAITVAVASGVSIDCYNVVGSDIQGGLCSLATLSYNYNGLVLAHSQWIGVGTATDIFNIANYSADTVTTLVSGLAFVDNLFEEVASSAGPGFGLSRDPASLAAMDNVIMWNNTGIGVQNAGRWNVWYDNNNTSAAPQCIGGGGGSPPYCTVRNQGYVSSVGNLIPQFNIKGDYFVAISGADTGDAPFHTGHFQQLYGVGFRDNVILYRDAAGDYANSGTAPSTNGFSQAYGGLNTYAGTVAQNAVTRTDVWTTYAGVTYNGTTYSAGAGNGTYTVCTAVGGSCTGVSPAYQHFLGTSLLPFTVLGTAIPASSANAGAF